MNKISRICILCLLLCLSVLFAINAYSEVPADQEDVYYILSGEADAAIAQQDYATAAQRIKEAMDCEPDNPSNVLLLSNLGTIYNYLDEDSLALVAFNDAIERAPAMTIVLENRGRLFLKLGRDLDAYKDFERVIELDSCNYDARYYHGLMALKGGDAARANSDFAVLESIAPDNTTTLLALSTLYSSTNHHARAVPYLLKLVEREPTEEHFDALIECYLATDSFSEATVVVSKAIEAFPDDAQFYYLRAWINKQRYLLKEAREDAKRAIQLGADPKIVNSIFEKKDK